MKNSDVHSINTRNKNKLVMPATRLQKISGSFKCQCIRFYNKIPSDIQKLSINKFKAFIKHKLSKKGFYKVSDYMDDKKAWD